MVALSIRNISKSYSSKQKILDNFSLEVNNSEFLVLVGPSGCGKSTLIRCIAGLEEIDSGEIYANNQRIDRLAPKDRQLSMVFQNYALYPHKTVYENIAFPLEIKSSLLAPKECGNPHASKEVLRSAQDDEVITIASKLGLTELLKRKPKELSGGQRQRVALARALIKNPEIFLLDEPLSNLDAKLRTQMRSEIARLHQESGKLFIYVTHDQVEALTLADRIVVLNRGVIQQIGSPEEIYNNPANTFVASFIGAPATNLIPLDATTLASFKNFKPKYADAILGLRPEQLSLEPKEASIQVILENHELLGHELIVYTHFASAPEQKLIARLPLSPQSQALTQDNNKDLPFYLYYSLRAPYYFDKISLSRLGI